MPPSCSTATTPSSEVERGPTILSIRSLLFTGPSLNKGEQDDSKWIAVRHHQGMITPPRDH